MNGVLKKIFPLLIVIFLLSMFSMGVTFGNEVIQTQESDTWDEIEVDLISLEVRNDIVTLRFKFRNEGEDRQEVEFYFKDCYIMDEVNQKKYYPLKDSDGLFIGGPKSSDFQGGSVDFKIQPSKSKGLWLKFPQPTDNPETITISIPGVFPFEGVQLIQEAEGKG
jgi:hypothetical protein